MKKIFTKTILSFILLLCFEVSNSQQLFLDNFNYSGNLTANGWTAHSGVGVSPVATTTGLSYSGIQTSGIGNAIQILSVAGGEDVNKPITTQNTDGQNIYFSALVNVNEATNTKTGDYFLHLGGTAGATLTTFAARVFARTTASGVNFGISNGTIVYGSTNFAKNTTYLLVVKYTINVAGNDAVSLWVIPSGVPASEALAGTPESVNIATAGQNSIASIVLRQGGTSVPQTVVDGIIVGLTWADVTPSTAVGPTLNATPNITNISTTVGVASVAQSFNLTASNLTPAAGNVSITPTAGLEFSFDNITFFTSAQNLAYTAATITSTPIYVRITNTAPQGIVSGNITISGGGATNAVVTVSGAVSQNYYNTKANLGLTNTGTWSSTLDGLGSSPANFTDPYQYFNIVNQANANYTGVWNVTGTESKIIVGDGVASLTFNINPGVDSVTSASKIDVLNNGLLSILNNRIPALNSLATGSTVNFSQIGTTTSDTIKIPALSYYNLNLTSGLKYFSAGTTTVRGSFLADAVTAINGSLSPFSTINALGNVSFTNGSVFEPTPGGDAARLTLKMNGSGPVQQLNGAGTEIRIFRLQRDSTATNSIQLGLNTNLTVGNATSGGLLLTPAATTLAMGANTINFIGGAVSTTAANGKISSGFGTINVLKSAGAADAGTLRFALGAALAQFTLNLGPAVTKDSVTIAGNLTVGFVNLIKGKIVMTAGDTLSSDIVVAPTVAPYSFVDGALRLSGSSNLGFAVGKGNNFAPVGISNFGGGLNTYTVHYFNTGFGTYTIDPATLGTYPAYEVSRSLYWKVTSANVNPYDAVFGYTDAAAKIFVPNQIRIANFDNTDWADKAGTPDPLNTTTGGTITVAGITEFGPFTFSALVTGVVPVKLSNFAAQKIGNTTKVIWTTEQELNSKEFAVERSVNGGRTWNTISIVPAAGNSSIKLNYSIIDNLPAKGVNLYRLRLIDIDNKFTNSNTKAVLFSNTDVVLITPNPASSYINILMSKSNNSITQIIVADVNGKVIERINTADQSYQINVSRYAKGIYMVKVMGAENTSIQKVIVQ